MTRQPHPQSSAAPRNQFPALNKPASALARVTSGALIPPLNADTGEQVSRRYVKFFNANIGMPERPPRLRDLRDRALVATITYLFARLVLP